VRRPPPPSRRRALTLVVGLAVLAGIAAAPGPAGAQRPSRRATTRPNILFVLTDDMNRADLHSMPGVERSVGDRGMKFTRAMVSVSLCCPSRTTILRGQYAHNTGVETNGGTNGGFEAAYRFGVERSTIATWLRRTGYRTGLIGKYLNGFPNTAPESYRPPGWSYWVTPVAGNPYNEYGYRLNVNGHFVDHGFTAADYGTSVYLNHARQFIAQSARAHKPWFLDLALYAPHRPATPAPGDVGRFAKVPLPRPPSFNESDISDKPRWLRTVPLMTPKIMVRAQALFDRRRESLLAVDRGVVSLVQELERTGQLDNTYVVFTSDNGFHTGEHRLPAGKETAFEEDIRVPLLIRGPGVKEHSTSGALVGNVDFAPTFARLAGVVPPAFVDGRSFADQLHGRPPPLVRRAYLIEHWPEVGTTPRSPKLPLEPPDNDQIDAPGAHRARPGGHRSGRRGRGRGHGRRGPVHGIEDIQNIPEFHGIRTATYTYVEYVDGDRELYDLRHDPYELTNVYDRTTRATRIALTKELAAVADCRGRLCRAGDARPAVDLRFRRTRAAGAQASGP
jgi:arylsulfatase A-like enzyme